MKFRFIRVAVLSAFVLTSPLLIFAAGQPKLRMLSKNEIEDVDGVSQAVQQGKGAGLSRSQVVLRSNRASDYHLRTATELPAPADESSASHPNRSDSALRK